MKKRRTICFILAVIRIKQMVLRFFMFSLFQNHPVSGTQQLAGCFISETAPAAMKDATGAVSFRLREN